MFRKRAGSGRRPERPPDRPAARTARTPHPGGSGGGRSGHRGSGAGRWWRGPRSAGIAALLALSTLVAIIGVVQAGLISRGPAAGPPEPHSGLDGLQAAVTAAQWLDHDHVDPIPVDSSGAATAGQPGYQMPAAMMPGMPADGQTRLLVRLNLDNDSTQARALDPAAEFVLRDDRGGRWSAQGDTFGGLARLNPRNGVAGGVFFDVPTAEVARHGWVLDWTRGGHTTRLAVSVGAPAHSH
ncbi:MAG: hypothetical protein V7637_3272 [Mycobacteriales bacterium]|jgi:hypothetical protein